MTLPARVFTQRTVSAAPGEGGVFSPESWRVALLRLALRFFAAAGALVYLPSVFLSVKFGQLGVAALDTVAMLVILAARFLEQIPAARRAVVTCLVLYGLGTGLLVSIGSIGEIYLFGFSILTTLLFDRRWGLLSAGLNVATMLGVGILGAEVPELLGAMWNWDTSGWALVTFNFALVNAGVVLVIGGVLETLERALDRSVSARDELSARQGELLEVNQALQQEVLERIRTEESLRESRALLHIAGVSARLGGWRVDLGAQREQWSDELCELCEVPAGSVPTLQDSLRFFRPAFRAPVAEAFQRCGQDGTPFDLEAEVLTARGTALWVRTIGRAARDASGAITHIHGSVQDVTPQREAQARHDRLEEQLRQAQKMESIGSLAGGIAHDFNNLMSVVLSYSELLAEQLAPGDPKLVDLEEIRSAGERAATLTRQLLAFSRQQVLEPEILPLEGIVAGMERMLRRLIGEDQELVTICAPSLGQVLIDPGQLEQVVMNLVINARDAMPHGGRITIETAEISLDARYAAEHVGVTPGAHAMLAVSDTGLGMDEAVKARIFEPFFTTKEKGRGTGLGLATVFGIVRQSGGTIDFTSVLAEGTTFRIYFPIAAQAGRPQATLASPDAGSLRGSETILLVEDENTVRALARSVLRKFGYLVLEAQNAGEALLLCEQHLAPIHLLLTDVVMPRMSGRQLAERLMPLRPEMKVLYMSGYTDDEVVRRGVLAARFAFLQKPITPEPLARKVREVLDGAPAEPLR